MEFHIKWLWNICFVYLLLIKNSIAQSCQPFKRQLICSGFKATLKTTLIEKVEEIMSFSKNDITGLDSVSFNENFNNVKELYLDNNQIKSINPLTFKNLPKLEVIDLSYNNIESLHPEVFKFNKELKVINFTSNKIEHINVAFLQEFHNLKEFILSNNPIKCNCDTMRVLNYFEKHNIESLILENCAHLDGTCNFYDDSDVYDKFVILIVVLFIMLLLVILLGVAVALLFCKVTKKQNRRRRKQHSERSDDCLLTSDPQLIDEDGYLIPTVPANIPRYTSVLGTLEKPNIFTHNLLQPEKSTLQTVPVGTHKIITPSCERVSNFNSKIENEEDLHVYEEVKENVKEKSFYRRFMNMKRYGRIKI